MNLLTRIALSCAVSMALLTAGNSFAQSTPQDQSAEKRVTIEPYKGPPIFLDEPEQIAAPTVVERQTLRNEKYEGTDQVRVERDIVRYSDNHIEADGAYREFYPNGQVFVEGKYTNGRQNGEWTYYHQNGEVNRKVAYKDSQPDGAWEVHRADGTLAAKRAFAGGQRDGEWIIYDPSGKMPIREEHYIKGKQDGVWKTWFPDGKLKQELNFKDGLKHGPSKEWDEKGEIRLDVNYVDDKLDGTATAVLPDGRTVIQKYEAGRLISEQTK